MHPETEKEEGSNEPAAVLHGEEGCHAGVFIYKNDSRVEQAIKSMQAIGNKQMIRGELHKSKEGFASGLGTWNNQLKDDNAFLCIYAHMGSVGINCYGTTDVPVEVRNVSGISWEELSSYLPKKIEMIWLLGCKSKNVLAKWQDYCPAKYLFVTFESENYVDFLELFAAEITFNPITPYDEMPEYLAKHSPELAKHTEYYICTKEGYKPAFANENSPQTDED